MKTVTAIFLLSYLLCLKAAPAAAHQPRLVQPKKTVEVKNPEISQAFYATLQGQPDEYHISTNQEFNLYVNILVPARQDARRDFTVGVYNIAAAGEQPLILKLDGGLYDWKPFFEPFAGDNYYQGPEAEKSLPAGTYSVKVSNPANEGQYVLAVGKKERFTVKEAAATVRRLPAVKKFFGKSPWTAFFNLTGLFIFVCFLLIAAAVFGFYRIIKLVT